MTLEYFFKNFSNDPTVIYKIAEVFDCESNLKVIYDIFPFVINDSSKYDEVSIFYQKFADGHISEKDFYSYAKRVDNFIKYIWLYNKTFAYILSNYPLHDEIKTQIMHHRTSIYYASECIVSVNSIECLKKCVELGIKEKLRPIFVFPDYKIILVMDGLSGEIIYDNSSKIDNLKVFSSSTNIFLDKR